MSVDSPSFSPVRITRSILFAIALLALVWLMWQVVDVFVIAFGGIVFATVLRAVSDPLGRWTGWNRRVCVTVVVCALALLFVAIFWMFGHQAVQQVQTMREQLPAALEQFRTWLEETRVGQLFDEGVREAAEDTSPMSQAGVALTATVGGLANLVLILFTGVYFAADPGLYREGALRLLPPPRRPQVRAALNDAGEDLGKWLVAQLIIMAAVGTLTAIGLKLLGVPLALSLGLVAGLFDFVPVVGPIAAAVPGILLAFTVGPETALYAALLYLGVQQIEGNLLTPLVQRWAVKLPPVVALLSIVAFGLLFGVLGVIFATPIAVVVIALVRHLYVEDTLERNGRKTEPPAPPRTAERERKRR